MARARGMGKVEEVRIRRLQDQLERWRKKADRGRRIPVGLWAGAVELAGKHGVGRVSRRLRLDYYSLKRRLEEGQRPRGDASRTAAGFVEIKLPQSEPGCPCLIEMRGRGGVTMLVRMAVCDLDRVGGLAEAFWRHAR